MDKTQPRPRLSRLVTAGLIGLALILAISLSTGGEAEAVESVEAQVKAAILVKLTKFVEWPADRLAPSANLKICLLGESPMAAILLSMGDQLSQSHALEISTLASPADHQINECHVLYLGESDAERIESLSTLRKPALLTVADSRDFATSGGMIELVRDGSHIAFRINLKMARAAGLNINAQLLALATIVE